MLHISDEMLDRLGTFYCSDFVTKQMPWLKEIPFHVWVAREIDCRNMSKKPELCN